jgi:hypothetical protein
MIALQQAEKCPFPQSRRASMQELRLTGFRIPACLWARIEQIAKRQSLTSIYQCWARRLPSKLAVVQAGVGGRNRRQFRPDNPLCFRGKTGKFASEHIEKKDRRERSN